MSDHLVSLAAVTVLGVLEQAYFALQVIYARRKFSVSPPSTSGPPEFQRVFRAQANCSEYFPLFITLLWTAGVFLSPGCSAVCGLLYLYGRLRYFSGYRQDALQRTLTQGMSHRKAKNGSSLELGASLFPCSLGPLYFCSRVLWVLIGFSGAGVLLSGCRFYLQLDLLP
ncbi:leukotriene C4 synthase isoform 1-T1 [Menidia menidia]